MSGFYAEMVFDLFRCCWSECTLTVKSVRRLWISISFKQSKLLKKHWRELDPIFKCIDNSISLWFVMGIQWIVIDRGHKIIMTWTVRSLFLSEREHQSIFSGTDQHDQLISLISNQCESKLWPHRSRRTTKKINLFFKTIQLDKTLKESTFWLM